MKDTKYIVFKRSDWDEHAMAKNPEFAKELERLYVVADAAVLRSQDFFTGQVFSVYAGIVSMTTDLIRAITGDELGEECDAMTVISDHFFELALAHSEQPEMKLPD